MCHIHCSSIQDSGNKNIYKSNYHHDKIVYKKTQNLWDLNNYSDKDEKKIITYLLDIRVRKKHFSKYHNSFTEERDSGYFTSEGLYCFVPM